MDKPVILKIKDTEESLINAINKSELPAFLLRPIVEKIFNQLVQTEKNEVTTAMMQFNKGKESVSDETKKSKPTK
jgi:hypothetical protein